MDGVLVTPGAPATNPTSALAVAVSGGIFTTTLDFGADAINDQGRWLEIEVRCPAGTGAYTLLSDRVPLTPAPFALALPGVRTSGGQLWITSSVLMDTSLRMYGNLHASGIAQFDNGVGIGTTPGSAQLQVKTNSTTSYPQLLLREQGSDYARLSFQNDVNSSFWTIAGLNTPTAAGDQLNFYDSAGGNVMSLTGDGYVGIGTAPETPLHVQGTKILLDTYGGAPQFTARTALGSPSGRGAVGNGQTLVQLGGFGWDGSTYDNGGGWIELDTAEAWTPTHHGTFWAFATTDTTANAERLERMRIIANGNVGIGTGTPGQKLSVNGNICYTGTIGACSDRRFKEHIEPVTGALATLANIQGVRFDWKRAEFPEREFSDQRQIGFIAQEVKEVLPEVVQQGTDGYYNVDYGRLTPIVVEAVKEQQAELNSLRGENAHLISRIGEQQAKIDTLESRMTAMERAISANTQPAHPMSMASIGGFAIPALALLGFVGLVVRGRAQNGGGR